MDNENLAGTTQNAEHFKSAQTVITMNELSLFVFKGNGVLYKEPVIVTVDNTKHLVSLRCIDDTSCKKELTLYDRAVHDALVINFVYDKINPITPQMIYRTMKGDCNAQLDEEERLKIKNSLYKLRHTDICIISSNDWSIFYEGALICVEKSTAVAVENGECLEFYYLLREPILYTYTR